MLDFEDNTPEMTAAATYSLQGDIPTPAQGRDAQQRTITRESTRTSPQNYPIINNSISPIKKHKK